MEELTTPRSDRTSAVMVVVALVGIVVLVVFALFGIHIPGLRYGRPRYAPVVTETVDFDGGFSVALDGSFPSDAGALDAPTDAR